MQCWMFCHVPLEHWNERWIANYKTMFDAWEDGGVTGIVFGRMRFLLPDGSSRRAYPPDPRVFESFSVSPPEPEEYDLVRVKVMHRILDDAAGRGWHILFFALPGGGGNRPVEEDPFGEVGMAARAQDLMNAFPQTHGFVEDAPGEQPYELAFRGELLSVGDHQRFTDLGFSVDRLERGAAHLRQRFTRLTPDLVRYHADGGVMAGLTLFDINEDVLYWLRARRQSELTTTITMRRAVDRLNRKTELGYIARTTTFSSLTAQNYQEMAPYLDYLLPKHYYWHRGWDGMYGTFQRWVKTLGEWNPALEEEDCFAVVKSLYGLQLPGIESLNDLELGFSEEFFSELVCSETRRALAAVQDDNKVVGWVSTGRSPHAGEAMTGADLQGILTAAAAAGLKRFVFHPDPDLSATEWHVISGVCGNPWREDPAGYWPGDSWRADIQGYG